MNRKVIIFITVVVVLIAFLVTFVLKPWSKIESVNTPLSDENTNDLEEEVISNNSFDIVAVSYDRMGVDLASDFLITSDKKYEESKVESLIEVTPQQDFSITKKSEKEYLLKFNDGLKSDSIYKIALKSNNNKELYSWAFQTKKQYNVVRSLPRDKGIMVPVNSGIEITFNQKGKNSIVDYFEISPQVNGRFEFNKETAIFIPETLQYDTIYKVTIKKGVSIEGSNELLIEDFVFEFQTETKDNNKGEKQTYFNFSKDLNNFTSDKIPYLEVYADREYENKKVIVDIYKYDTYKSFKENFKKIYDKPSWVNMTSNKIDFKYDNLNKVKSFESEIYYTNEPLYKKIVSLPENMEEGHYLVVLSLDGNEYKTHIQVNDMLSYIMLSTGKALIWTNDSVTGEPISGVKVSGDRISDAITDVKGIAEAELMEEDNNPKYKFLTLSREGRPDFLAHLQDGEYLSYYYYGYGYGDDLDTKYWSYLYLDRGMYLPTDTIKIWGLIKPREDKYPFEKATVEIGKYTYNSYDNQGITAFDSKEISLTSFDTFTQEFEFSNLKAGSYYIIVKVDGEMLEQKYFQVTEYIKPAYKIEAVTDKKAIFYGDELNVDVDAKFFEGSPVSKLDLSYSIYGSSFENNFKSKGLMECDENGKASLSFVPKEINPLNAVEWRPKNISLNFYTDQPEEKEIREYETVSLFPRDIMIDGKGNIEDGVCSIQLKTNKIDISKLEELDSYYYPYESYKGEIFDTNLKIKVHEQYWEKKKTGTYYDFVNKITRDTYEYFRVEQVIDEFEVDTVNGLAEYEFSIDSYEKYRSYYLEIIGYDTKNRPVLQKLYMHTYNYYPYMSDYVKRYTMSTDDINNKFMLGEEVSLNLLENYKDFEIPQNGMVLLMYMKNGLLEVGTQNEVEIKFDFKKEYMPNAYMKAVYFDGKNIYNAGIFQLNYDYSEKELDIIIKPDKENYRPGETVNLDVEISDSDGNPCAAEVNISVVDEAFFAMRDQSVNTLSGIYSYVFPAGVIKDYFSITPVEVSDGMAECGEGGDEGPPRQDFKDSASFLSISTNDSGKGKVTFDLPDNLTSWRITYQAVTEDLKGGNGKLNINSKLPFFINPVYNDVYLEGDKPGILCTSYGEKIHSSDTITYEMILEGADGYKEEMEKESKAGSYVTFNLNNLKEGTYSLTIYGNCGDYNDAVKKEIHVVKSLLEASRTTYYGLEEGLSLSSIEDMTELTFYIKGMSDYYRTLNSLTYSWGQRVDQKLATVVSRSLMNEYFDTKYSKEEKDVLKDYQINDGGIALLPYDSSSPELSAKVVSLASEYFDELSLKTYFLKVLDNKESNSTDIAASFWGLAALREPVLLDIRFLLENSELDIKERLYLGIALAELGDYQGAMETYKKILQEDCKVVEPYVYIDKGDDRDDYMELTSLLAIIALETDAPEKMKIYNYIMANATDQILINLEKLIFVTTQIPESKNKGTFTYELDGKSNTVTLSGHQQFGMVLTPDKLQEIKFSKIDGDMEVAANYIAPIKDLMESDNQIVAIKRSYSVKNQQKDIIDLSDIVAIDLKIEFGEAAPEGYYEITDVLPSGLIYIHPRQSFTKGWYWGNNQGQRVTFGYYYERDRGRSDTIRYYTRVMNPGEYIVDNAIIKHGKSDISGFTLRDQIIIGN